MKTAKLSYGKYYCECGRYVHKVDNYCSQCGAELEFFECKHTLAHYSRKYIDYDRTCYEIFCIECNTRLADLGYWDYERMKGRYNIVKEY